MTDPALAGAVLVGTSRYLVEEEPGRLSDINQVAENLVGLAAALGRPGSLFPAGSVETVLNPEKSQVVFEAIARQPQRGTLLFYYAGHGISADYRLCLGLPYSIDLPSAQRASSLPLDVLLEQLTAPTQRRVILILDCCYSALALDETRAADVHLLTAVGRSYKARWDGPLPDDRQDAQHTVFTHPLLRALNEGIPDGTRFITLDSLYRYIRQAVLEDWDDELLPHQRAVDDTGLFRLAPNPAYEAELTPRGLSARDALATQAGLNGDLHWAARLSAGLAADCDRSTLISPAERFVAKLNAATWCGRAGEPEEAVRQFRVLISRNTAGARAEDGALAAQGLEYWERVAKQYIQE